MMNLASAIKATAWQLGFTAAAIVPADPGVHAEYYRAWIAAGYHAEMAYLARPDALARRADMALTVPRAASVVVVAANYHSHHLPPQILADPSRGIIAGYAWGIDYHAILMPRLYALQTWIADQLPVPVNARIYVDTGPVLERGLAAAGGLGFIGKNTCLIQPHAGSYLFLAEIILDYPLPPDPPLPLPATCGNCTRCLAACPTDAFTAPYILNSHRCLAYLTIELKGDIPEALRPALGNRIFGCDVCQQVCPYNRRYAIPTTDPAFRPLLDHIAPPLLDLLALDEPEFRHQFQGTPLQRTKRRGLLRNVCVALGNWGDPAALPALQHARRDPEPLIVRHAEWAITRISHRAKS